MTKNFPPAVVRKAKEITGKRARIVVDHILKHGSITTEDLRTIYGYDHPPRAIKDVTDQGLPLSRKMVQNSNGRRMASYTFGDPGKIKAGRIGGRSAFSKAFKDKLTETYGRRCAVCNVELESRYLQIDHRVPYDLAGEADLANTAEFMLLCSSCNRSKSWSCEHCTNFLESQDPSICMTCYWANPIDYLHIATQDLRRIEITWQGEETRDHDQLKHEAARTGNPIQEFAKSILRRVLRPK